MTGGPAGSANADSLLAADHGVGRAARVLHPGRERSPLRPPGPELPARPGCLDDRGADCHGGAGLRPARRPDHRKGTTVPGAASRRIRPYGRVHGERAWRGKTPVGIRRRRGGGPRRTRPRSPAGRGQSDGAGPGGQDPGGALERDSRHLGPGNEPDHRGGRRRAARHFPVWPMSADTSGAPSPRTRSATSAPASCG